MYPPATAEPMIFCSHGHPQEVGDIEGGGDGGGRSELGAVDAVCRGDTPAFPPDRVVVGRVGGVEGEGNRRRGADRNPAAVLKVSLVVDGLGDSGQGNARDPRQRCKNRQRDTWYVHVISSRV